MDIDIPESEVFAAHLRLAVSLDALVVTAELSAPLAPAEIPALRTWLNQQGIVYGVSAESELGSLLTDVSLIGASVVLAQGDPPVDPVDEALVLLFDTDRRPTPLLRDNDTVDYRELGILQDVVAGQVVAYRTPQEPGRSGRDVYGREIPALLPRSAALPQGPGTEVSVDGMSLRAAHAGQIVFDKQQNISVLPVYHVRRDVDFSTGNIDFVGSVRIDGSVRSGFTVKAGGNIDVRGIVEAASLEASGSIVIRGGVQGSAKSKIVAGASVQAQYLQNSTVEAEGNVTVFDSIMNSVVSGYAVRLTGKRGLLVGGVTHTKTRISVRTVGSPLSVPTRLEFWPDGELYGKVFRCEELLKEGLDTLTKIGEALVRLQVMERRLVTLPAEQSTMKERLEVTYAQLQVEVSRLRRERERALQEAALQSPAVEVAEVAYPGVHLAAGHIEHQLQETVNHCAFVATGNGWEKRTLG